MQIDALSKQFSRGEKFHAAESLEFYAKLHEKQFEI